MQKITALFPLTPAVNTVILGSAWDVQDIVPEQHFEAKMEDYIMFTARITLSNIDDVKRFVQFASGYDFEIELSSGKYTVDAKSIMGIFSLDLSKPITVEASCDSTAGFCKRLKEFSGEKTGV